MKFKDLNFINGKCQLDYNYYVLSFSKITNEKTYECAVFNRVKLPVDLPGVKIEKIKNNKWVKIHFTKKDVEDMLIKFWAITGIKDPKQLNQNEFYKDIF
tara:strand:+ start:260 stop:559 length:300 start_codon:yes stop_codon:yes gene_type:complete